MLALCLNVGCQQNPQAGPPPPAPTVTVARPIKKQIVEWDAYTGRLEAIEFVEVRARVSGYLKSIHFDEGAMVDAGELLFVIDPRPFQAELNAARAALSVAYSQKEQSKAQLEEAKAQKGQTDALLQLATTNVKRFRTLRTNNTVSEADLDQSEAEYLEALANVEASKARIVSAQAGISTAEATIESAQVAIETAQLNLDYTQIRSPVTGRISRQYVTDGNFISGGSASSTLLTTITSVAPIYCTFDVNEQDVLKYVRLANSGERASSRVAKNPVYLGLIDEAAFPHEGHMDFVDNRFDTDTATMRARSVFPNADHVLLPGMFARIRIPGSAGHEAILIPDSAIGTDQSNQFVYIVVNNTIERRIVRLGSMVDGLRVVREGLSGDESLVIAGLLQSRPGLQVQSTPGTIEMREDGLPDSYEPLPPEKWISPEPDPRPEPLPPYPPAGDPPKREAE
ncbi:efflux RND transporter periplasmic adaptor subunit [Lignipirellula cremea]|uniref:efflux RND transporter periplasmic adaptor subunit n=1 Tax=Lignipirellula cremea TaxID=2528010 RepID=UPI001E581BDC|nr:efflux RND transporter periplasmic adaptor subunit [Lignipirellula cremea]